MFNPQRFLAMAILFTTIATCGIATSAETDSSALLIEHAERDLKQTFVTPYLQRKHQKGESLLWCSTFQLAWNDFHDKAGGIELEKKNETATALNAKIGSKNDLDSKSYVARCGVGPKIVAQVLEDLKRSFGDNAGAKLIPDPATIKETDIVAYAYLFKSLSFKKPYRLYTRPLKFEEADVKSFGVSSGDNHSGFGEQTVILDYSSDSNFVVELKSENKDDRLIVARIKPGKTLQDTVEDALKRIKKSRKVSFEDEDTLQIPMLNFDLTRLFPELIGQNLIKPQGYFLTDAVQRIRFRLDETGAVLKSESRLLGESDSPEGSELKKKPHHLVCDGPFLILMMRHDAKIPYFAFWVENPELLVSFDKK